MKAIGIDLGTTNSCVGVFQHGKVEIIKNFEGNRTIPSYVAFTNNERLFGEEAEDQIRKNSSNTVFGAKRLIGRKYDDPTVSSDMKHWPFNIFNDDGKIKIKISHKNEEKTFCPEEISSMILAKMKETAESFLGGKVKDAVITVPAYFNDSQRQATIDAGVIAGLNVLKIMNEPTAAAIAYGLGKKIGGKSNVLIFDLGGGTFDVSIISINGGVFEVKSTAGDTHLGGEDFDIRLVNHFIHEVKSKCKINLPNDKRTLSRLRTTCERVKRFLSTSYQAIIEIKPPYQENTFNISITRTRFEELCSDLFRDILECVEKALKDSKLEKSSIDEIVLVGGSTQIPKIQELLQEFFNGKDLNKSINLDEAVAYGAAVQAAILTKDKSEIVKDLFLIDVVSLSLGIKTEENKMDTLIKRNTTIPTKQTRSFKTDSDTQSSVSIEVFEGENVMARDNNLLGEFKLTGIPSILGKFLPIEVIFSIDVNGILNVTVTDISTEKQSKVTITNNKGRLSQKGIKRMIQVAEKFKAEDEKQKENTKAKNTVESFCILIRRIVEEESTETISEDGKKTVLNAIDDLIKWLDDNPFSEKEEIQQKQKYFIQLINPIMEVAFCEMPRSY